MSNDKNVPGDELFGVFVIARGEGDPLRVEPGYSGTWLFLTGICQIVIEK